jgi:hypothetical protein
LCTILFKGVENGYSSLFMLNIENVTVRIGGSKSIGEFRPFLVVPDIKLDIDWRWPDLRGPPPPTLWGALGRG